MDDVCFNCGEPAVADTDTGLAMCHGHTQMAAVAGWKFTMREEFAERLAKRNPLEALILSFARPTI